LEEANMNMHSKVQSNAVSDPYIVETSDYFRVSRRVYVDPDVFAREKRNVFGRCWLYIGHESEIANKGDFVVRTVAEHSLIFLRGRDNQARVFFNVCPHRGAVVCRENSGNTKLFRCLYHAWAFDTSGKTVARPEPERYSEGAFKDGLSDLRPVPRVENHRGFYFINYDPKAESLKDFLAGAAEFLDRLADKSEIGMEVVGGLHPFGVQGNWKSSTENFLDLYHIAPLHQTYFDYLVKREDAAAPQPPPLPKPLPPHRSLGNGHAVMERRMGAAYGRPVASAAPSWGEAGAKETAEIRARLHKRFGKEYGDVVAYNDFNMVIFPNIIVSDNFVTSIRTYEPNGIDKAVVNSWLLAPKEESETMRGFRMTNMIGFMGPGGLAQADDAEAVEQVQRGYHNLPDGWNDLSRGIKEEVKVISDEESMRCHWREWNRRMLAE
jgi:p-cumate 2,3-dioxygenase subunit alpha